ncbi:DNA repair protein RAD5B [Henckelia pumila]|uniref:DNA repair protein RAD5B n=1 Tax=Henckelia pumila TaxID=405737 RepID=UPI003C6E3596
MDAGSVYHEEMQRKIKTVKSVVGPEIFECNNNVDAAANYIFDSPSSFPAVIKTSTSTGGARISSLQMPSQMKCGEMVGDSECGFSNGWGLVKHESTETDATQGEFMCVENGESGEILEVKEEFDVGFGRGDDYSKGKDFSSGEKCLALVVSSRASFEERLAKLRGNGCSEVKEEVKPEIGGDVSSATLLKEQQNDLNSEKRPNALRPETKNKVVKEEPCLESENKSMILVKDEVKEVISAQPLSARKLSDDEYKSIRAGNDNSKPKMKRSEEMRLSTVLIEDGDFAEEPDWLMVGRTVIIGLSTTKGRKLENNEIVQFAFPSAVKGNRCNSQFYSAKAANAASSIVRFSTKRSGEIGRLPMEWAKCLVPLVSSSKVKVLGRCIAAPVNLALMQEIMLYVSFYIHHSIFTESDLSSWKLEPSHNATTYPLLTLFKLLKVDPFQKAEFTPEELDSRKRHLNLDVDSDETAPFLPGGKRRNGCQQLQQESKDEQIISESSLNKLVGAADMYNLEEMEPPKTLTCKLKPYQKQALYWMFELEKGECVEEAARSLHPCWAAYRVCDERAPAIYVNTFSGEASTKYPTATQMARGGILADAMGLGKTVMTIALIHTRNGRGSPEDRQVALEEVAETEYIKNKRRDSNAESFKKVKGGTLIICPMALLGQWKDELETHSAVDSISIFVHYGGGRTDNPRVIAGLDVVLTTYGVLTEAYKKDSDNSIFHRVEWHRVVLDEAHTIKSSRTVAAQAAFALSSYCRWCLTGTPIQNKLEDLYSLLCFLHVEPWCNWAWWNKLVQRPYDNGDPRGMKMVKAILRTLMLRRTKESKDKDGRPILVLPPTEVKVIECEQTEAERDFYEALFKKSKVQFDQFVAQGKVLHNYANILELLLRLRQCCNHPYLVMSRGDSQKYADLNKLARRFLETDPDSSTHPAPSRAYVEEVVKGLQNGENAECPICLESADDPVLTPCAHRMCRECLLSSWRTPVGGLCPICRQTLKKTDLITCPTSSQFRIDIKENWKESSKISKLLDCLEAIRRSGSGEKSIVFSQWTSFLDLLEIPLKDRKIEFLRFDGKLVQKQRERVLHEFAETQEKTVLLMSLKAGGVGLNLTAASNVFLMDPWWNPAVEAQAVMRIHRIGQKRTVRVRRFICKDTVEERLQQVQARKERMIAGALTDDEVRSARIEELKMLFR